MPGVILPSFKNKGISDEVTKRLLELWREETKQYYSNKIGLGATIRHQLKIIM